MALSDFEIKRIEKIVGSFIERRRPPADLREKVDLFFRIAGQSFEILEIRPMWDDPSQKIEVPIAKATYVKKSRIWKLYWMRADMKWHKYPPFPESNSLEEILEVIDEDSHCCFWG